MEYYKLGPDDSITLPEGVNATEGVTCSFCKKEKNLEKRKEGYYHCKCCNRAKCINCYQYDDLDGRSVIAYNDGSRYEGYFQKGYRHGPGRWIIAGVIHGEVAIRDVDYANGHLKKSSMSADIHAKHNQLYSLYLDKRAKPEYSEVTKYLLDRVGSTKDYNAILDQIKKFMPTF